MKDLLNLSENEQRALKLGLLLLAAVLLLSNIRPAYEGISKLPIWQPKGRSAQRSPNFKAPPGYQGALDDLPTTRFVNLDVLVVVFKKIDGSEISSDKTAEIRREVKRAREFFWRNSNLQLNINPTFFEISDSVPAKLLDDEGKLWPKSGLLEKNLLGWGIEKNQYDLVFVLYPHSAGGVSGSGMKLSRLGKTAYSFVSLPVPEDTLLWTLVSQLWYSINTVIYGQEPVEVAGFEELAAELKRYPIQDPPKPYGEIYVTVDYDRDGVPDDEPLVAFDESRLGLNRETNDSDNDGLEDKRELTAGIFRSTDLFLQDTDGDGLKDGEDPNPFNPDD